MTLSIQPMEEGHLPEVHRIERLSYATPWSAEGLRQERLRPRVSFCRVAVVRRPDRSRVVVGYLFAWIVGSEAKVNNVAVDPSWRRRGVGRALLEALFARARERGCRRVQLEVRESNAAARELYRALGFRPAGRRPGYYSPGDEDALLLERSLEAG